MTIYHHIRKAYPIDAPTLEQVVEVIMREIPNISAPGITFEELATNIYNNYTWYFKNTERN